MTQNNNGLQVLDVTLKAGDRVVNTNIPGLEGNIYIGDKGELRVRFDKGERKNLTQAYSPLWVLLAASEQDNNSPVVSENERKGSTAQDDAEKPRESQGNGQSGVSGDVVSEVKLTDDEAKEFKKLEGDLIKLQNTEKKISFQIGEILNKLRKNPRFWQSLGYSSFSEYAIARFGMKREYLQNLAQMGAFFEVVGDITKKGDFSVNAVNQLMRNQNVRAEKIGLKDTELEEFKPFLDEVIDITLQTARKDGNDKMPVITPKIVDTVDTVISDNLDLSDIQGDDLLARAAARLAGNKTQYVSTAKAKLVEKKEVKKPSVCEHSLEVDQVENDYVYLTCGCKFRLIKA